MTIGIYCIRNTVDGKRYIGKSKNIEKRWERHKSERQNRHVANAMHKYGLPSFEFTILERFDIIDEMLLADREIQWMDFFKTLDRNYGYNLKRDSSSKTVFHKETIKRMSEAQKSHWAEHPERRTKTARSNSARWEDPEYRAKRAAACSTKEYHDKRSALSKATWANPESKARHTAAMRSPKTRAKMSRAATGRRLSPETRAKVSAAGMGRVFSADRCAKISASKIGKPCSAETRAKLSAAMFKRNAKIKARKALLIWMLVA